MNKGTLSPLFSNEAAGAGRVGTANSQGIHYIPIQAHNGKVNIPEAIYTCYVRR